MEGADRAHDLERRLASVHEGLQQRLTEHEAQRGGTQQRGSESAASSPSQAKASAVRKSPFLARKPTRGGDPVRFQQILRRRDQTAAPGASAGASDSVATEPPA
jgi:hypothetical protein